MTAKVVVIGGGMAGCAAAVAARKRGAEVTLFEKNDELGGLSLVAGCFGANGQLTALEEAIAMGATEIPEIWKKLLLYKNFKMPGKEHVSLYDCRKSAEALYCLLDRMGIVVKLRARMLEVKKNDNDIVGVTLDNGEYFSGNSFVDATGTSGPSENCKRYGNGCVVCPCGCPTFGNRISLTAKAGIVEGVGVRGDGKPGTITAAFTLVKETLAPVIRDELAKCGSFLYKVPESMIPALLNRIGFVPTSVTSDYAEYLTLEDNGYVNVIGIPFMTREELRTLPGFEDVQYVQPHAGWLGNAVRYMAVAPRDNCLRVRGVGNLFVAGDKVGGQPNGVTEAFITGTLAGFNAGSLAMGVKILEIPQTTAIGDFIAFTNAEQGNMSQRHSLMWGPYFKRMCQIGLYSTDVDALRRRVSSAGMDGVFRGTSS